MKRQAPDSHRWPSFNWNAASLSSSKEFSFELQHMLETFNSQTYCAPIVARIPKSKHHLHKKHRRAPFPPFRHNPSAIPPAALETPPCSPPNSRRSIPMPSNKRRRTQGASEEQNVLDVDLKRLELCTKMQLLMVMDGHADHETEEALIWTDSEDEEFI